MYSLLFYSCFSIIFKAKEQNIDGNMKGDGFQNGGALIVKAGMYFWPLFGWRFWIFRV